jgi:DNA-binding LacI/PurR family transcriptional regulator
MRHTYPKMIKDIQSLGIPIVAVDNMPRVKGINSTQIDNKHGGGLAADHLFHLGHQHIAFLTPTPAPPSIDERLAGFRLGFERNDRKFNVKTNVIHCEAFTFESAYETMRAELAKSRLLTGVFCANDEMAAGVLRAAREVGRRVPGDLSVIGFDDITMSNYVDPPLTTVGVVKEHMGRRAMTRLLELVEATDTKVKTELIPVDLVIRGSTAKVRKGS